MMMKRFWLYICLVSSISMYAQTEEQVLIAWQQKDYAQLIKYHALADSSLLPLIEDAIALVTPNIEQMDFNQIDSLRELCINDPLAMNLLTPVYNKKKCQILALLYTMNSEELLKYLQQNPSHQEILYGAFEECVYDALHSIPLSELLMLHNTVPSLQVQAVHEEINNRTDELKSVLKANIHNFIQHEYANLYRLQYVVTRKTHAYLYARYSNVCYQYAAVENLPEDTKEMEKQFAEIVKQYFSSDDLQQYLQLEVDAYCETVNASRIQFCKCMGLEQYLPMKIVVPQIKIGYKSEKTILDRIPQAKEDYANKRESIDNAANVANWFTGGIGGWLLVKGGKMLAERWAGSSLSEKIIYTRLSYLESCYNSLLNNFEMQIVKITNDINEQVLNNEVKFIEYVKSN